MVDLQELNATENIFEESKRCWEGLKGDDTPLSLAYDVSVPVAEPLVQGQAVLAGCTPAAPKLNIHSGNGQA